jgi:hypothetical protein
VPPVTDGGPWRRALSVWLLLICAESVHGVLRQVWLVPLVGDFRSRQIGVFTGSILVFLMTLLCIRWIGTTRTRGLIAMGAAWVVLTLAFEFTLGRALGADWRRLFADYDLVHGGLMPLGLAVMLLSPLGAARLRHAGAQ